MASHAYPAGISSDRMIAVKPLSDQATATTAQPTIY